jgi:hypothetical protein
MLNIPNAGQASESISSDALEFYRAEGQPIRLELPLIQNKQDIVPYFNNNMDKESDYPIFQLANTHNLHQVFGPVPSAKMLIQDILQVSLERQHHLYLQRPLTLGFAQFPRIQQMQDRVGIQINLDQSQVQANQWVQIHLGKQPVPCTQVEEDMSLFLWGNNWEASSSSANRLVKMDFTADVNDTDSGSNPTAYVPVDLVEDSDMIVNESRSIVLAPVTQPPINSDNAYQQATISEIINRLEHQGILQPTTRPVPQMEVANYKLIQEIYLPDKSTQLTQDAPVQQAEYAVQSLIPIQAIPPSAPRKRKSRKRPTPMVNDEVKRSARLNKVEGYEQMELDARSKPRKLFKEDTSYCRKSCIRP